jgi:hypothetical protein
MDDSSYALAKLRYARMRRAAYALAREDAIQRCITARPFRLSDIDHATLSAWRRTWAEPHPSGEGGWDWAVLTEPAHVDPAALSVALWSGGTLCGLALARASHRRSSGHRGAIKIYYLEGNPDPLHPLKGVVAALLVNAAEAYGRSLGASKVRLVDPLPGALRLYSDLGFTVVRTHSGALYCEKEILR